MRRCICGQSRRGNVCDGSHATSGWNCSAGPSTLHAKVFAAGNHGLSVAERLAHTFDGALLHRLRGQVTAEELIVVTDGSDLHTVTPLLERVDANRTRVLVLGAEPAWLASALPEAELLAIEDAPEPGVVWHRIVAALDAPATRGTLTKASRIFLSHAVQDEPRLLPAVESLRKLALDVFVCGDSIRSGIDWRDRIFGALKECDRFVLVLSPSSRASSFCAFESGAAMALGKPIQLVSLDGEPPPAFLAHLQMDDLARVRARRPWLDDDELLLDALIPRSPS